jgi:hypothetical protein
MSAQTAVAPTVALLRLPRVRTAGLLLGIAALTALAVVLRQRALGAPFWIDEGLSVGIASHPLTEIPSVLRLDGSPPLYYLLLHLWIGVAGDSVRATHELSALFAVLAVPAAAWAVRPVFGVSAALAAAALVALSPFVGFYADEGRMYSLVFLLATLAAGALLRAFVLRRRRWAAGGAVLMAALLYTHAWGAFFVGSTGVVGVLLLAFARDRRALFVDLAVAFGGAALLLAPWVPTALEQSRHTGAPWSHAPSGHSLTRALTRILSGISPEWVLLVAGGAGALLALWRGNGAQRRAILSLVAVAAGTLLLGYLASRAVTPAWSLRYLVIVLAPLLLAIGAGLARLGPIGVAAIAVVALTMWNGAPSARQLEHKSNVARVAAAFAPRLPAGSVVFSEQPEQVAVLRYYLPGGLRYATPLGPVPDPRVMDWRDAMRRMRAARYESTLGRVAQALRPGQRLLLVDAQFGHPSAPWTRAIHAFSRSWPRRLRRDRHLRLLGSVSPLRFSNRSTVSGLLFVRTAQASAPRRLPPPPATVRVRPDPRGRVIPPSALGLSIEWDSVEAYTGRPGHRHTALVRLLAGVAHAAGSPLALRIGGDSGDQAWWNPAGRRRPRTILQNVTPRTLGDVAWLAGVLHAPVTLGLNLARGDPRNALALARAAQRRLPAGSLEALEIGNEPDLYTHAHTFRVPGHVHRRLRKHARYDAARWVHDTAHYLTVLRRGLGPGPRLSVGGFAGAGWWRELDRALGSSLRGADVVSGHLYALPSCSTPTPSMTWLLSRAASHGRVAALAPLEAVARRHRLPLRVTELNSAACGGRAGLSERFGAALWLADTLFTLQHLGVGQADVHTWLHARYAPFAVRGNRAVARPGLVAMRAFARAAPRGSRLAAASVTGSHRVRAWATTDGLGVTRVALIARTAVSANVRVHGQRSCAQVWLADAARTVTDRRLCSPYRLELPARSLAVLTFPAG